LDAVCRAERSLQARNYVAAASEASATRGICEEQIQGLEPGVSDHIAYFSFGLRALAVENAARLMIEERHDLNECVFRLETAMRNYHSQGGPQNNPVFAFILSLLAIVNKRRGDSEAASRAWSKADELVDDSAVELFRWGRSLFSFALTVSHAESVLNRAYKSGNLAKSWVEGAAAIKLAELCETQRRNAEALEFLKAAVRLNYVHLPTLRRFDSISRWQPGIDWYAEYANSDEARAQLRPPLFGRGPDTEKPRLWSKITRRFSLSQEAAGGCCNNCGQRLRHEHGDNILFIKWDLISEWLSEYEMIRLGLRCKQCGLFGACCWHWHTYDELNDLPEPAYVPLCPRCGEVLQGGLEREVGPMKLATP